MKTPVTTPPLRKEVAGNVRAEMARRGVTQVALAGVLGIHQTGMSHRLTARTAFTVDELLAVADHLRVPVSVLLPAPSASASAAERIAA